MLLGSVPLDLGAELLGSVAKAVTWLLAIVSVHHILAPGYQCCFDLSKTVNLMDRRVVIKI